MVRQLAARTGVSTAPLQLSVSSPDYQLLLQRHTIHNRSLDDIQAYLSQKEYPSNSMLICESDTVSCRYEIEMLKACHIIG